MKINEIIKQLRINSGMTQKELAEKIGLSESAIQKWEKGKHGIGIAEAIILCKVFNVSFEELCPEINETKKGRKTMLENLEIIDSSSAKAIEYYGIAETTAGFNAYYTDMENYTERCIMSDSIDLSPWQEKNHFSVLIDLNTDEINGIRDFGSYLLDGADFLFKTQYIPVRVPGHGNEEYITNYAKETKTLFLDWICSSSREAKEQGKRPLFLIRSCGENNYLSWSTTENKYIYVYEYKSYRKDFYVSDADYTSVDRITINKDYKVYGPDMELVDRLDLFGIIFPDIWKQRLEWDRWDERELKQAKELLNVQYNDDYKKAVEIINIGRKRSFEFDDIFVKLELRTERFEKLDALYAPDIIIESVYALMQETSNQIQKLLEQIK